MTLALDRVELSDLARPEQLVAEILRQNPTLPLPVPVNEICSLAGITEVKAFTSPGFEGMLLADEEKFQGVICFNAASPRQRQRFTIAHELGHFLLPWHKAEEFQCSVDDMRSWSSTKTNIRAGWEVDANQFAAHLLMPATLVHAFVRPLREPNLEHAQRIAERFDTSREASARRLVELSDYPCALVVSKDNVVRYCIKSEFFPWWVDLKSGVRLPRGSSALAQAQGLGDEDEAANEHWLAFERGDDEPSELYEQTLAIGPFKLTLLTAVD